LYSTWDPYFKEEKNVRFREVSYLENFYETNKYKQNDSGPRYLNKASTAKWKCGTLCSKSRGKWSLKLTKYKVLPHSSRTLMTCRGDCF
jgi:hypothetical protein